MTFLNQRVCFLFWMICVIFVFPLQLQAFTWSDDPKFSGRVHQYTVNGKSVEVFDVDMYLYRTWEDLEATGDDSIYTEILQYWADGIYEMSNGANYLGTVTIYTGDTVCATTPCLRWSRYGTNPSANMGGFWGDGVLNMYDTVSYEGYTLDSPQKRGGVIAHETMHWIYDLPDEYGSAAIGSWGVYSADPGKMCGVREVPGTNKLIVDLLKPRNKTFYNKYDLLFCLESYRPGVEIQFSEKLESNADSIGLMPVGVMEKVNYMIDSIELSQGMIDSVLRYTEATFYINDATGDPVVFGSNAPDTSKFYIRHAIRDYWASVHAVGHKASATYVSPEVVNGVPWRVPLETPQYQWLNFGTKFTATPHNVQGRTWRTLDDEYIGQWQLLTDTTLLVKPAGWFGANRFPKIALDHYIRSLAGREPDSSDVYSGKTMAIGYSADTCKYDSTALLGNFYTGYGKSERYIKQWSECHDVSPLQSTYPTVTIPYMKVELNDPIHKARARQYLETRWVNLRHNIAVVIDFSGSMKIEDKIIKAKEKAKQVVETAYLAHDSSMTVSIVAFSDSVLRVFETDHNNYQQKLQELDDFNPHMGQTAIYDAIEKASSVLKNKDEDTTSRRAIFLVSDGNDNASDPLMKKFFNMKLALSQISIKRWKTPIHTFPFGTDADTAFLARISRLTDGDFWGANVEDPSNLNMAFSGSMSGSSNIETQLTFNLQPGESAPLVVSPNTRSIIIYGNHDLAASGDLIFTTPSGNTHTAVPTKLCLEDRCYLTWRFYPESDSLESGLWTMTASGTQIEGTVLEIGNGAVKYTLKAKVNPNNIISAPEPIVLTARLKGPVWSVTGYQSQALLSYPDGSVREIPMNDEGLEGDETAGDGLYTYTLRDYSQEGHYQLYFEVKNTDSSATFTAVGISIQGTMPAFQPLEDYIIRSSRVDFMVDSVAADDHLSPPEVLTALYQGGDKVYGRIDFEGDEDWFVVEDLDLYKDLGLALYTPDDSAVYTLEVYYPMDINKPLITKSWSAWDEKQLYIPASRLMSGMRIRLRCDQSFSTYEIVAYKSSRAFLEVGRFEEEDDWSASSGSMELRSAGRFEGDKSLFITSDGWREITSRKVHTQDITQVSNRLSMRVYVPANPVNPYWIGTVSLKVSIPSAAKSWDLGEQTLNNTVRNMWNLFHWNVPADLKATLAEPHPDVQFIITLNGNAPLGLDYLHFSGDLEDNWVDAYEIVCPEPGCSPETAIDLGPANSTKRFAAYGNIWLKISEFPTDWSPSHLHFGIVSEDGQPITGEVEYMGQIYDLEQWYQQFDEEYLFSESLLIRLNNVSGRPYRIHWWADGYREVYSSPLVDWRLQPFVATFHK